MTLVFLPPMLFPQARSVNPKIPVLMFNTRPMDCKKDPHNYINMYKEYVV